MRQNSQFDALGSWARLVLVGGARFEPWKEKKSFELCKVGWVE